MTKDKFIEEAIVKKTIFCLILVLNITTLWAANYGRLINCNLNSTRINYPDIVFLEVGLESYEFIKWRTVIEESMAQEIIGTKIHDSFRVSYYQIEDEAFVLKSVDQKATFLEHDKEQNIVQYHVNYEKQLSGWKQFILEIDLGRIENDNSSFITRRGERYHYKARIINYFDRSLYYDTACTIGGVG